MSESILVSLIGSPVAPVNVADLKKVWTFLEAESPAGQTSVSLEIIVRLCGPGADALAVWGRATFLQLVASQGLAGPLNDKVFQTAATFPLPHGLGSVDADAFLSALG